MVLAFLKLVPLKVWAGFAAAILLAFLCWRIYAAGAASRDDEVAALQAQVGALTSSLATAQDANASNMATIDILRADNKAFADAAQLKQAETAAAVQRLESRNARLQGELTVARQERQTLIEGNEHAKRWAETAVPTVLRDDILRRYGPKAGSADGDGALNNARVRRAAARTHERGFRAPATVPDALLCRGHDADVLQFAAARLDRRMGGRVGDG